MTHFISLTILPIVLTLFAFILYCCSIYGSHICGASVMATVLYLKLYQVVWLELPSFVTSGYPCPSALIVLKVKMRQYSEYPLHHICTPPTLGHCSDSKAYSE